jgi:molybdenum cofactor cytidylyltransferase
VRTFALVPAAGHSRRMGRPKLALPLGESTVLGCVVASLRESGVDEVLVVVGPHVAELAPLARSAGASALLLDAETPDMRTTVERGLRWLQEQRQPAPEDGWLLCPADHPALQVDAIRAVMRARSDEPNRSIIIPTFQGKRGHPALIAWKHVAALQELPPDQGINVHLRSQAAETLLLPVAAEQILCDLDTPEDYERLVRSAGIRLPNGAVDE